MGHDPGHRVDLRGTCWALRVADVFPDRPRFAMRTDLMLSQPLPCDAGIQGHSMILRNALGLSETYFEKRKNDFAHRRNKAWKKGWSPVGKKWTMYDS